MTHTITLFAACLFAHPARVTDHRVGGGEDFPAEVRVGDVIRFDRPAMGGKYVVEVRVNGKTVNGHLIMQKMEGRALIGGGRLRYEVKAVEAGPLKLEITITPAGEKSDRKTHLIDVRK